MTRSHVATSSRAVLFVALVGALAASGGPVAAQTQTTFADEFDSISYSGSDGSDPWSGPWIEVGDVDGPGSGVVRVVESDRCRDGAGNCLRIGSSDGYEDKHGAVRSMDLDGASSATLSFEFRREREGEPSGKVRVQISSDGGASWTTLWTIKLKGTARSRTRSRDITQHATDATTIRFVGLGTDDEAYLHIDHVMVVATYPEETTTTTTAPPPAPTTTTSTAPPPGPTTTTTTPLGPTTTTTTPPEPPATTTSMASGPTSTAPSAGTPPSTGGTSPTVPVDGDETVTTTIDTATTTTTEAMVALGAAPPDEGEAEELLSPIAGLRVPFATNSEVFSNSIFSVVALAALTGGLSVAGLETRRKRSGSTSRRSHKRGH